MERKEAIEVIKKNYPHVNESDSRFETALRTLIPELKESEDKKIRRCISDVVKEYDWSHIYGVTKEQCLAWIEKQDNFSNKEVGNYDHKNVLETLMNEQTLNKSEETLEELGKEITNDKETATKFLKSAGIMDENGELAEPYRVCESIFNWSEEDEKTIDEAVERLENYAEYVQGGFSKQHVLDLASRVESLKDRYTWKPSDEQMHYLSWIANVKLGDSIVEQEVSKHLNELLEDLKKLREE